jgi:hypothetical protein
MTEQGTKPRRGCLFYGLIIAAIFTVVLIIGAIMGIRYAKGVIDQLTDTQPMTLPKVTMSDEQMDKLRDRIENFRSAVQQGQATGPLTVTPEELNALISTDPDLIPFRNRLYVSGAGEHLQAQISVPAEELGLEKLKGKYVNATGTFSVGLRDGALQVNAESLQAKGKPLPENIMREIRTRNLAQKFNNDTRASVALGKLQDIQVKDGKLIIVPKK